MEAIDQLRTLDPDAILADSHATVWMDQSSDFVRVRITESLIDPQDGHLGYTQIIRLAELARFVFWRSFLMTSDLDHIQDCTLVALQARFMSPMRAGQVIELQVRELHRGSTSLNLQIDFRDLGSSEVASEIILTLVALDPSGKKVTFTLNRVDGG